ncbi:MAG: response regulator [Lachnospiraceae bacterium]|nr:response regulator [Lachnospiraceae bacterium]
MPDQTNLPWYKKVDLEKGEKIFIAIMIVVMVLASAYIARGTFNYSDIVNEQYGGVHDTAQKWTLSKVMETVSSAIVPLLCTIAMIISSVIMIALDVLRVVSHRRLRGLLIMAFFAVDSIFYSFVRSDILYLFFGNREFFRTLEEISYIGIPVFVTAFFFRGFKLHFPTFLRNVFYINCVVALVNIFTYPFWGKYHDTFYFINVIWKLIVIIVLMVMLVKWKKIRPEQRKILLDELGLAFLFISIASSPVPNLPAEFAWLNTLKILSITAYFILLDGMHSQIMIGEYRFSVEKNEKMLMEKNESLEIAKKEADDAKEEAVLANEAKSRFLANMSHEIRTPINAVLGMDEMILRESKDKSIREYAADIKSAGQTLLSLINEILDFSKIESGKMELAPGDYEFAQMITDLTNMIAVRARAKDLEFILKIDNDIPCKLFGDDVRLRQCIMNILTNAVKYTPEGSVTLVANGKKEEDKFLLHIEVIDTGIGIKEEDIPKLFQEYERIEESRNRNIEGTGLGMNITLSMLKLMDSHLQVKSVYGEGSTFYFDVYQGIVDETPVGDIAVRREKMAEEMGAHDAFIAPDAKILVTDDNAMNRKVFKNLLKATQMQIDEAESGPQAIELAKENRYNIIFMDHMMPDMDGIEAMHRIKELPAGSPNENTPIYVLTANAVAGAKEMYMEEGFDGFLSKPVVSDKIEEVLKLKLPAELILPAPEGEGMGGDSAEVSGPPADLPNVDGLDWNFAWLHLPGEDMLTDSVKQFYDLIEVHGGKLQNFYDKLPEELDNYRIQVHGMKSSAATIGIVPLAGMAKILEFAAKDENIDRIHAVHDTFIAEWYTYLDKLDGVFGIVKPAEDADSDLPAADYTLTVAICGMLKEAMEDFDVDKADEYVLKLKEYSYPEGTKDIIKQLAGAVSDLDSDLVNELCDKITENGEW